MFRLVRLFVESFARLLYSRRELVLENLLLRQQLAVLKSRNRRPRLAAVDKFFLVLTRRFWAGWRNALLLVTPETVVRWHRAGFRLYWKWLSRRKVRLGRKRISREVRDLVFQRLAENSTWCAPRIHGELKMLGFEVSERTLSRWIRQAPRNPEPGKRWRALLRNHREVIAAMDFFTVPTLTLGVLDCFFIIAHDRRRILHFNVTRHPTGAWVMQQLREAFPFQSVPQYLIFDRDSKFDLEVMTAVRALGSKPTRRSLQSPWQNGVAERWGEVAAGTCLITSLRSMSATCRGSWPSTFATTMRTERISASGRKRPTGAPPRDDGDRNELFLAPGWADYIIVTILPPENFG